jgi:hypothetical protein
MDWIARNLQSRPYETVQDFFWGAAGPWWWTGLSFVAVLGAAALFINLMLEVQRRRDGGLPGLDALMIGRIGWMGALFMAAGIRVNSGLQIWALALFVTSGTFMAILIVTNWCNRHGSFWFRLGQVLGEIQRATSHDKPIRAVRHR